MNDRDRFDQFTERTWKVLSLAQEEAQHFQHNYIGTEHLLLALVREGEGVAAKVLVNLGVELNKVRSTVEFIISRGDRIVLGEIGLTPRAKKVIELATDEAHRLNHHYIGTEHLLLGLVREGEGIAAGVLESLGVNLEKVHTQIIQMLSQSNAPQALDQSDSSRVLDKSDAPQALDQENVLQEENNNNYLSDQFTMQAKKVLGLAKVEAQRLQHNYIGTEHLLLGLVSEGEGIAAKVLATLGVEQDKVRSAIEFIIGRGDQIVSGEIDLTPRAKKVIELAVDEARRLKHHSIGTEHLLLGLIREGEGIAAGILESLGINLEKVRVQTVQVLSQSSTSHEENSIQGLGQSEVSHEEDSLQELSQSDTSYEEFDDDTESTILPVANEIEEQDTDKQALFVSWSQEASDNLRKIASDAAQIAQKNPGRWVNPLQSYLVSRIRYAQTPGQIRRFLLETACGEDVIRENFQQYSAGYFQAYFPKMDMLLTRVQETEAISALNDSWYEEIYQMHDERYGKVIRLIKRMGGLETDKMRAIKSWHCFTEPSAISGYKRFVSADRRFPVSVSYPSGLSFFYDFNDERNLHVDWDGDEGTLGISRENFGMSAQSGNRDARLVLQGKKDIAQFMLEDFAQRHAQALIVGVHHYPRKPRLENKIVGEKEHFIEAKRLVWLTPSGQYGGEWVFFIRARLAGIWSDYTTKPFDPRASLPELWTIYNSLIEEEVFNTFLSSFQWLSLDFFHSLPAQP